MEPMKRWTEAVREKHPLDAELFGTIGAMIAELCTDVSKDFIGKQFEFLGIKKFQEIGDTSIKNQVYWKEMLSRVHWAAALNLMRHQRWQAGCVGALKAPANLLSFAANLRGLVEASLDAAYSLKSVPYFLTNNRRMIESALEGSLQEIYVCGELEEHLIHFVFARKIDRDERGVSPESHTALEPKDYRNAIDLPEKHRESFRELYDKLCGICHPTAFSLTFLWDQSARDDVDIITVTGGQDETMIRALCWKYEETIGSAMRLSVTVSALCLKALNWFSLPVAACPAIERWNFDDVLLWRKMQGAQSRDTVH